MQHFVYFIQSRDPVGLIKIGHCKDVANRLLTLQTGSSYPLKLLYSFPQDTKELAIQAEKRLHGIFEHSRRRGEWFTPCTPLRETIAFLASGGKLQQAFTLGAKASKKIWSKLATKKRVIEYYKKNRVSDVQREAEPQLSLPPNP